jgi:hypothetical protein
VRHGQHGLLLVFLLGREPPRQPAPIPNPEHRYSSPYCSVRGGNFATSQGQCFSTSSRISSSITSISVDSIRGGSEAPTGRAYPAQAQGAGDPEVNQRQVMPRCTAFLSPIVADLTSKVNLTTSHSNRGMNEIDLAQPAIVFWVRRPGEISRFEQLREAVHFVMQEPLAPTAPVAWIRTADRHLTMDEIRQIAGRFGLTWRIAPVGNATAPKRKRFSWGIPPLP